MDFQFIFSLVVLLFSVVIHEISHGYAALALGDHTAEYEGRLTLNPVKHIDMVGTIILPVISIRDLIKMKKAAGRDVDKLDIEELKKIRNLKRRNDL